MARAAIRRTLFRMGMDVLVNARIENKSEGKTREVIALDQAYSLREAVGEVDKLWRAMVDTARKHGEVARLRIEDSRGRAVELLEPPYRANALPLHVTTASSVIEALFYLRFTGLV